MPVGPSLCPRGQRPEGPEGQEGVLPMPEAHSLWVIDQRDQRGVAYARL